MPTLSSIKADILTLNDEQQANLLSYLSEILSLSPVSITDCREARFSKGKACPHVKVMRFVSMESHVANNVINVNLVVEHLLTFQNRFYQVQSCH